MAVKTKRREVGKTKNGRIRVVALNKTQLFDLMEKSNSPKLKDKVQRRINLLNKQEKLLAA